ncbi:rhodanese-like domain-containing protein [Azospirillum sp. RWY-5-1]|uniref:Rhodanese-like domain-containing protein n=1 Tax=Azospirillum oleiclasticum TaxID=2735135 RepID=A0ABX2TDG9_9PROT|nr:rhodanese-like domain-containing protein [Azospirillum oleiclasticum]NYZ15332.1 rhodanese-like domain-containing protein [Azospirillum oleiclasticum]NYZ21247.1 rhodanese-like domain-containing protein [Azospirillum oleiclasticum]
MALTVGYRQLLDEANARIETLPLDRAAALHGDPDTLFVDIRDPRELARDGMIPGAFHAPRGMLEFWVDPDSPYHKPVFASGQRLVLYCASAWRSALSTDLLQRMGVPRVCHLEGGFSAWKKAGLPVDVRSSGGPEGGGG